jgi:nucleoid-associated protein YgaU
VAIQGSNGVVKPTIIIEPVDQAVTYNVSIYTWKVGDQIEYLAFSAYGDETQWWRIANANPEVLFWNSVQPGQQIRVPRA